mgnify:CR=1 FL=1
MITNLHKESRPNRVLYESRLRLIAETNGRTSLHCLWKIWTSSSLSEKSQTTWWFRISKTSQISASYPILRPYSAGLLTRKWFNQNTNKYGKTMISLQSHKCFVILINSESRRANHIGSQPTISRCHKLLNDVDYFSKCSPVVYSYL